MACLKWPNHAFPCIKCETPADRCLLLPLRFYIGCDQCQDWFHGGCVGVTKAEADKMDVYICPNCQQAGKKESNTDHLELHDNQVEDLAKLTKALQVSPIQRFGI